MSDENPSKVKIQLIIYHTKFRKIAIYTWLGFHYVVYRVQVVLWAMEV